MKGSRDNLHGNLGPGNVDGNDSETTSNDNAACPREGGTSEAHRPQLSQRAAATAHPQPANGFEPPQDAPALFH
jgi:hypothetical protein